MASTVSNLLIQLDDPIESEQVYGEGCYGKVYQVKFNGALCIAKKLHDILTTIPQSLDGQQEENTIVERFHQECIVLNQMRHPNVVQFIGIYQPTNNIHDIALVMEQLHFDLKHFIEDYNGILAAPIKEPGTVFTNSNDFYLPVKLSIIHNIICGLLHIHSHKVLHRDLNPGNILLTRNLQAKVADLGVARSITPSFARGRRLTKCPGSPDCMPPEALIDTPVYENSLDVFSLGHVMLYLVSCKYPTPLDPVIDDRVKESIRTTSEGLDLHLGFQAQKRIASLNCIGDNHCTLKSVIMCLSDIPENRPSLGDLEKEYTGMCSEHSLSQDMIWRLANKKDVNVHEECDKLREENKRLKRASIQNRILATEKVNELSTYKVELEALQEEYDKTKTALEKSEAKLQRLTHFALTLEGNDTPSLEPPKGAAKPLTEDERFHYEETIKSLRSVMEQTIMENEELITKKKKKDRKRSQSEPGARIKKRFWTRGSQGQRNKDLEKKNAEGDAENDEDLESQTIS